MSYVPFLIGSTFECFGVFFVMFSLFRFRLTPRAFVTVALVAFMMSQVSYFTRLNPETESVTTYIQFAFYVLVLWSLFRVSIFYSIIMNFAGFASLVVLQSLTILVLAIFNHISLQTIKNDPVVSASIQVLSFVVMFIVSRLINHFNVGFDFVPTSRRHHLEFRSTNVTLFAVITTTIVISAVITYVFRNEFGERVIYSSVVFLLTLPAFLYFALRKDNEDAA